MNIHAQENLSRAFAILGKLFSDIERGRGIGRRAWRAWLERRGV